jgi:hypothetical protein
MPAVTSVGSKPGSRTGGCKRARFMRLSSTCCTIPPSAMRRCVWTQWHLTGSGAKRVSRLRHGVLTGVIHGQKNNPADRILRSDRGVIPMHAKLAWMERRYCQLTTMEQNWAKDGQQQVFKQPNERTSLSPDPEFLRTTPHGVGTSCLPKSTVARSIFMC